MVCLPPPHHQHPPDSTQPNFSFKKGAIIACPEESWRKREVSSFGARCRLGGILGRFPSAGTLKDLPPWLLLISSLHSIAAFLLS